MKKIVLLLILLIPFNVYGATFPELNSNRYLIYDNTTSEILVENGYEDKVSIASLTKIMTVLTAIEKVEDLNEIVTVTPSMLYGIYWNASTAGLKAGDTVTYRDLLYAALLPSGADATHVLAYSISGSLNKYVEEMNNLAIDIGLESTHFTNVIGLDNKEHYSTLKDVLKLIKYALNNEDFREVFETKEKILSNGLVVKSTVSTFNEKMALDTSRIIGSKTGFTDAAGYCLESLINSYDHEVIIITLGAKRINQDFYHIIDTLKLITYTDEVMAEKKAEEERLAYELKLKKEEEEKERKQIIENEKRLRNEKFVNYTYIVGGSFLGIVIISIIVKRK